MVVQSDSATRGQKEIKTNWPVDEGLIFGTTRQTGDPILHATGLSGGSSIVRSRNRRGL